LGDVETWFSPACCNEDLRCELFLSRADLPQLQEIHVNEHLPPLYDVIGDVTPRNINTDTFDIRELITGELDKFHKNIIGYRMENA